MLLNYAVSLAIAKDTLWRYANIVVLLFCKLTIYFSPLFGRLVPVFFTKHYS